MAVAIVMAMTVAVAAVAAVTELFSNHFRRQSSSSSRIANKRINYNTTLQSYQKNLIFYHFIMLLFRMLLDCFHPVFIHSTIDSTVLIAHSAHLLTLLYIDLVFIVMNPASLITMLLLVLFPLLNPDKIGMNCMGGRDLDNRGGCNP